MIKHIRNYKFYLIYFNNFIFSLLEINKLKRIYYLYMGDGFIRYFTNVCDVTHILSLISYSITTLFLTWPNKYTKKNILFLILKFFVLFVINFFFCGFCFALDRTFNHVVGFYNFSFFVVPIIYTCIFVKGDWLHKFIKIICLTASLMAAIRMSSYFGIIAGGTTNDNFAAVVTCRTFPIVLCLPIGYLIHKFDINNYRKLYYPIVIIFILVSLSIIGIGMLDTFKGRPNELEMVYLVLLTFVFFIFLVLLAVSYYSLYDNVKSRHDITIREVQLTLSKAESDLIELDKKNREELTKLRHDLKNQLSYVNALIKENKNEEAIQYLNELTESNAEILDGFNCTNQVINSIINMELNKAKLKDVKIEVKAIVTPTLPFKETDLCSLITNMIDNAINYNDKRKPIKVFINTHEDYFRITVSNTIPLGSENEAKVLKTNKKLSEHGYGTKIIKNIANKYNGYSLFDAKEGLFVADVVLSLKAGEQIHD